jgi:NDP-sugar pyrophosphorylase family protein
MNLVIPIASTSKFFNIEDYGFPQPLIEIAGKPIIQHVIENLCTNYHFNNIIFIVKQDDCSKYHIDNTLKLLSPVLPIVLKLRSDTQGALCSVLLSIEYINNNDALMIANADQIFDGGISDYLKAFSISQLDAACLTLVGRSHRSYSAGCRCPFQER